MAIIVPMRKSDGLNESPKQKCWIDETFLLKLGFYRVVSNYQEETKIYRFSSEHGRGFDVIFSEEFGVLTVEEFDCDDHSNKISYNNTVVGMFHIYSTDDLSFIFSRNVRLNYVFNTAKKILFYK